MPYSFVTLHTKFENNRPWGPRDTRLQKSSDFLCIFFFFAALVNPFKQPSPTLNSVHYQLCHRYIANANLNELFTIVDKNFWKSCHTFRSVKRVRVYSYSAIELKLFRHSSTIKRVPFVNRSAGNSFTNKVQVGVIFEEKYFYKRYR